MNKEYILEKLSQANPTTGASAWGAKLQDAFEMARAQEAGKQAAMPKASFTEAFKTKGLPMVVAGVSLMTIFLAVDQIVEYLEKKGKAVKSKEYFQLMLKNHPQLSKEDPKEVAMYWESLYHFNPTMAEDPLASGAWITQAIRKLSGQGLGGPSPDSYATLTQIGKQLKESKVPKKINSQTFILPDLTKGILNLGL